MLTKPASQLVTQGNAFFEGSFEPGHVLPPDLFIKYCWIDSGYYRFLVSHAFMSAPGRYAPGMTKIFKPLEEGHEFQFPCKVPRSFDNPFQMLMFWSCKINLDI
jgi:hypothetical protein